MNHYKQAISPFGEREVSIEFGEIGRQADAAVMVDMEGTVVLVAVTVAAKRCRMRVFCR